MVAPQKKSLSYNEKEYFASGAWKCPTSPTKAHWWDCNTKPPVCKICGKVKVEIVLTE
ncbi:MAG: hypothetical protein Q7R50_07400 [Dehalococcoidales bacterium]|nr:hypothetical protein [Dehalococcoidales bacterium]